MFFIGKSCGPHIDLSFCNHHSIFGISLDSFENIDMYGHINAYTCVSDEKVYLIEMEFNVYSHSWYDDFMTAAMLALRDSKSSW